MEHNKTIIAALAEKVIRLEKRIAELEDDVAMWQRVYHEKNDRIRELETRLVAAGSKPNGSDADE